MKTIVDYLKHWASVQPDKLLYSYLEVDESERDAYTYQTFEERTRHVAEHIASLPGIAHGDRALLVYPPGLEIITAFFACVRDGILPVPVYPPTPMNFEAGLAKLAFVSRDSGARFALTTRGWRGMGTRDSAQDALATVITVPSQVRDILSKLFHLQFKDNRESCE